MAKKSTAGKEGKENKATVFSGSALGGLGDLFEGISRLVEAAGKVKESGVGSETPGAEGISRSGEFTVPGLGEKGKGIFGFTIRTMGPGTGTAGQAGQSGSAGAARSSVRIRPFGNVRKVGQGLAVEEAREPVVDVFEEADCIRVIAELPGVSAEAIEHEINGDILTIRTKGERCYSAEVLLPAKPGQSFKKESATSSYNNGIFELRLPVGRS